MVKAGFVLSSFFFSFLLNMKQMPTTRIQIALPRGYVPCILLDRLPARWVPSIETASWAHGISRAVTSGWMLLPPTISLVVSVTCPLLKIHLSPVYHCPGFWEHPQIHQDFAFYAPTCPYCLLRVCLAAVQLPSFSCPNAVIGYCCLLRNERWYLKGCYY